MELFNVNKPVQFMFHLSVSFSISDVKRCVLYVSHLSKLSKQISGQKLLQQKCCFRFYPFQKNQFISWLKALQSPPQAHPTPSLTTPNPQIPHSLPPSPLLSTSFKYSKFIISPTLNFLTPSHSNSSSSIVPHPPHLSSGGST